jgi:hypothetical protein
MLMISIVLQIIIIKKIVTEEEASRHHEAVVCYYNVQNVNGSSSLLSLSLFFSLSLYYLLITVLVSGSGSFYYSGLIGAVQPFLTTVRFLFNVVFKSQC